MLPNLCPGEMMNLRKKEYTPPEVIFEGENQTKESVGTSADVGTGKDSDTDCSSAQQSSSAPEETLGMPGSVVSRERERASESRPSQDGGGLLRGRAPTPGGVGASRGLGGVGIPGGGACRDQVFQPFHGGGLKSRETAAGPNGAPALTLRPGSRRGGGVVTGTERKWSGFGGVTARWPGRRSEPWP